MNFNTLLLYDYVILIFLIEITVAMYLITFYARVD